jgi:hypothetical protein
VIERGPIGGGDVVGGCVEDKFHWWF